jgi:hypothetical protein
LSRSRSGRLLGLIGDYERVGALADQLVGDAPTQGIAYVSRARAQAMFTASTSLADLGRAELLGIVVLLMPARVKRAAA